MGAVAVPLTVLPPAQHLSPAQNATTFEWFEALSENSVLQQARGIIASTPNPLGTDGLARARRLLTAPVRAAKQNPPGHRRVPPAAEAAPGPGLRDEPHRRAAGAAGARGGCGGQQLGGALRLRVVARLE